ncbi:hypothetical protein D1814_08375 [Alteromonas sp. BL110]|uniref:hypothetical protein n=1 Tax=Alteromonas sp. BL110 TaxID=1714845 RepID=UPI000E4F7CE7|nr:hypothetical protein [Alteromonas sp. BL110]AXT38684.1 hypothetical protein D1814_08375 [Alteromonas sp. BL110]RKM83166.1 hypothetical protein D7031_04080 [Alteromonas sp. BL110]
MPSRYAQFKEKLPISRLSDEVLLAFRVLFDAPLDIVDLAQDIADLAIYPERLKESYRKEWEAYVLKALAFEIRQHDDLSNAEFIELMMSRVEALQQNDETYQNLLRQVHHAKSILQSENTVVFPTPLRQELTAFLLPITTIPTPKK